MMKHRYLVALLMLHACADQPMTYYVGYRPTTNPVTCDQACGEGVSFCDRVDTCDEARDPEECRAAALELGAGEILIECAVRSFGAGCK
jgi:hypothetical protein